jgi:hypothetical protein
VFSFLSQPSPKLTIALRLDEAPDGREIQDYLQQKTGQSTVPNIFINKEHVGGKYQILIDSHPISPANDFPQVATLLYHSKARTSSLDSLAYDTQPEYTDGHLHTVQACTYTYNHNFFIRDFSF